MMPPHQERVIVERQELAEKTEKLRVFLDGKIFATLDPAEQGRLARQHVCMKVYLEILDERIAAFGKA
jgi:hypothetical protein